MTFKLKVLHMSKITEGEPQCGTVIHTESDLTEDEKSRRLTSLYRKYHLPCYQIISERTQVLHIVNR